MPCVIEENSYGDPRPSMRKYSRGMTKMSVPRPFGIKRGEGGRRGTSSVSLKSKQDSDHMTARFRENAFILHDASRITLSNPSSLEILVCSRDLCWNMAAAMPTPVPGRTAYSSDMGCERVVKTVTPTCTASNSARVLDLLEHCSEYRERWVQPHCQYPPVVYFGDFNTCLHALEQRVACRGLPMCPSKVYDPEHYHWQ